MHSIQFPDNNNNINITIPLTSHKTMYPGNLTKLPPENLLECKRLLANTIKKDNVLSTSDSNL